MRLHLVALPHTRVEPEFCGCAYTAKVLKFCKMMGARHEILLYSPAGRPVPGASAMVQCLSEDERVSIFGRDDPMRLPAWPTEAQTRRFNQGVIERLHKLAQPQDLVLLTGGWTHEPIARVLPHLLCIEPGVGYEGVFTNYCAFESHAWMHTVYAKKGINDIRWFDRVIPPYCDPDEFPHLNGGDGKYLLFLGRLISRKGPHIAASLAKACGLPLMVAGAGGTDWVGGESLQGQDIKVECDVRYVGAVGIEERARLLAGARALICPTTYAEPGGNVAVEAMLAGTPVITADFGVFSETVKHGLSGFHFRMFRDAIRAVRECSNLDPREIRHWANMRYSLKAVGRLYDEWFDCLTTLFDQGWYQH